MLVIDYTYDGLPDLLTLLYAVYAPAAEDED